MLPSSMAGQTAELTEQYLDHPVTEQLSIDIPTGDLEDAKSRQYHDGRSAKFGLWQ
ncbi:hypothetical protein [Serratia fonticola]|uniref:hypothetical protein n=1 Tax=Serratia fonticola TaxID=47917 RepID=UPI0013765E80|nr:hypothetical protein [Serratia fonticola]NCG54416.1 hypothetical protein [Serratia fonticola]